MENFRTEKQHFNHFVCIATLLNALQQTTQKPFWKRFGQTICFLLAPALIQKLHKLVHILPQYDTTSIPNVKVESGTPFHVSRDLLMNVFIEAGRLRNSTASQYNNKSMLLDVTYADAQDRVHVQ